MKLGTDQGTQLDISPMSMATKGSAILAMRGAGKSWLTALIAEQLAEEEIPFVIIDPEGEYWTLRVQYPKVIIGGGEHADFPLDESIAEILAETVVDEQLEVVLDLSDTRRDEQIKFVSQFLSALFVKETQERIPLWVCLEEADLWVPQNGNPASKIPVLDICQRGRKRGLGFALVSQRPATLDKTALSQAEFRFFKRFQQPQDLRAIQDYLGPYSNQTKVLPSLSVSEALLYAPTFSEAPIRFTVPNRKTPHGGATPEQIARIRSSTTTLSLKKKIEALIVQKKQELSLVKQKESVIKSLKKKIEELEIQVEKMQLANDIVSIINTTNGQKTGEKTDNNKESGRIKQESIKIVEEEGVNIRHLDSIIPLGQVGIDKNSGLVAGSRLISVLLNNLEPNERMIFLELFQNKGSSTIRQLSQQMGFSDKKVRVILKQLVRKQIIDKRRVGRSYRYMLAKEIIKNSGDLEGL